MKRKTEENIESIVEVKKERKKEQMTQKRTYQGTHWSKRILSFFFFFYFALCCQILFLVLDQNFSCFVGHIVWTLFFFWSPRETKRKRGQDSLDLYYDCLLPIHIEMPYFWKFPPHPPPFSYAPHLPSALLSPHFLSFFAANNTQCNYTKCVCVMDLISFYEWMSHNGKINMAGSYNYVTEKLSYKYLIINGGW